MSKDDRTICKACVFVMDNTLCRVSSGPSDKTACTSFCSVADAVEYAVIYRASNAKVLEAARELGRLWTVGAHLVDDSVIEKMDDLARTIRGE